MNSIMVAFREIEQMLKDEVKSLEEDLVATPTDAPLDERESGKLQRKVRNIGDLSKTMGGLMRNVIHEV